MCYSKKSCRQLPGSVQGGCCSSSSPPPAQPDKAYACSPQLYKAARLDGTTAPWCRMKRTTLEPELSGKIITLQLRSYLLYECMLIVWLLWLLVLGRFHIRDPGPNPSTLGPKVQLVWLAWTLGTALRQRSAPKCKTLKWSAILHIFICVQRPYWTDQHFDGLFTEKSYNFNPKCFYIVLFSFI